MMKSKDGKLSFQTGMSVRHAPRKAFYSLLAICASAINISAAPRPSDNDVFCLRVMANAGMSTGEDAIDVGMDVGMDQPISNSVLASVDSRNEDPCPDVEVTAAVVEPEVVVASVGTSSYVDCLELETIESDPDSESAVPVPGVTIASPDPIPDTKVAVVDSIQNLIDAAIDTSTVSTALAVDPIPVSKAESAPSIPDSSVTSVNPTPLSTVESAPNAKPMTPLVFAEIADQPDEPAPGPAFEPAQKRPDDPMIDSVQSRNEKSEQLIV